MILHQFVISIIPFRFSLPYSVIGIKACSEVCRCLEVILIYFGNNVHVLGQSPCCFQTFTYYCVRIYYHIFPSFQYSRLCVRLFFKLIKNCRKFFPLSLIQRRNSVLYTILTFAKFRFPWCNHYLSAFAFNRYVCIG